MRTERGGRKGRRAHTEPLIRLPGTAAGARYNGVSQCHAFWFSTQSLWIWGVQNRHARPSTSLRTGSGGHPGRASSGLRLFCLDSRVRGNDAALINPSKSSWQAARAVCNCLCLLC